MAARFEGTNQLSHICPYLEIRTMQAGGVFDYVAALRRRALGPPGGVREPVLHRLLLLRLQPDRAHCVKLAAPGSTRQEEGCFSLSIQNN